MTNPCAFCGHPDARHRTVDAILDRWYAGESMLEIFADYGMDAAAWGRMLNEVIAAEEAAREGAT